MGWQRSRPMAALAAALAVLCLATPGGVQRIEVGDDIGLVTKAIDRLSSPRGDLGARQPAVLVGAAVDLPLLRTWTPEHFAERLSALTGVKSSKTSTFAYWGRGDHSNLEQYAELLGHTSPYTAWDTLSLPASEMQKRGELQESAEAPSASDGYFYYSAPMTKDEVAPLAGDYDSSALCASSCPERVDNVWWSTKGVTAQAHYDLINNLFVQVHGYKKFVLFPPSAAKDLSIHPQCHPSARQSQAPVLPEYERAHTVGMDNFPTLGAARKAAIEVVLGPGDALYLPPYWIHHVVALNTTISYNVWWSDHLSEARQQMQQHISGGLNGLLDMDWAKKPPLMVAMARAFVLEVLDQLFDGTDGPSIARELWEQRYKPLFAEGSPASGVLKGQVSAKQVCARFQGTPSKLKRAAAPLADLMRTLPEDIQLVEAGDLIDQLALWLNQYNFLPIPVLHDFPRSLFHCDDKGGLSDVGKRRKGKGKAKNRRSGPKSAEF